MSPLDIRIVSTFNPAHWDTYFKRNLESWLRHWDAEVVVYHEGEQPDFSHERLLWRQLEDVPGFMAFMSECSAFGPAHGQFRNRYNYNYDAGKFCRKVYAQWDASQEEADFLVWLDADVEALRETPDLTTILNGMPMARYERPGLYTETGIVVWDMQQDGCKTFFRLYLALYDTLQIFTLPGGWHDCYALDHVVNAMAMPTTNLTTKTVTSYDLEVVQDSILGIYLRHDKGIAKYAA